MERHGLFAGFIGLARPWFEAHFTPCVEIGWRLQTSSRGRGLATEGVQAALAHDFGELGLDEIVACTLPAHTISITPGWPSAIRSGVTCFTASIRATVPDGRDRIERNRRLAIAAPTNNTRLYMPSLVVVAVLVPFLGFYVARVNNYREFLHDRGFRLLELATTQLQSEIDGMKNSLRGANRVAGQFEQRKAAGVLSAGETTPEASARAYLQKYLRDGEPDSIVFHPPQAGNAGKEVLTVSLAARSALMPLGLHLAIERQEETTANQFEQLSIHVPLDRLAGRLLPAEAKEFFDLIVLATEDGTLLGAAGDAQLRFTHLDALLHQTAPPAAPGLLVFLSGAKSNAPEVKKLTTADVAKGQQRLTVQFSGADYALFLEPTPLRLALAQPLAGGGEKKMAAAPPPGATHLLIGGLAKVSTLESSATAMPAADPVAVFLGLSSILVLIWPTLKLVTMSPKERLRPAVMVTLAVGALGAAVVLAQLYLAYGFRLSLNQEAAVRLRELSAKLSANFSSEVLAMLNTLEESRKSYGRPDAGLQTFKSLSPVKSFSGYPFFSHLYAIEPVHGGPIYEQVWKLSADPLPTPLISMNPSAYPALSRLRSKTVRFQRKPGSNETPSRFGLQTVHSTTTGEYLTIAAIEDEEANDGARYRMMSTRLISLSRPLMEAGYEYAVLDRAGLVKYHSEPFRAGRENFLKECLNPGDLAPFLGEPRSGPVRLDYGGRRIRAFAAPLSAGLQPHGIEGLNWTLVTFRRANADQETVFQAGLIQLSLVGMGLLLLLVAGLLFSAFGRAASPKPKSLESERRFWPRARHRALYILEIGILGVACLAMLILTVGDWGGGFRRFGPLVLPLVWLAGAGALAGSWWWPEAMLWQTSVMRLNRALRNVSITSVFALRWTLMIFFFVVCGNLASFPATVKTLQLLNAFRSEQDLGRKLADRAQLAASSARALGVAAGEEKELVASRTQAVYDLADVRAQADFRKLKGEPLAEQGWFVAPLLRLALPIVAVTQEGWPQTADGLTLRVPSDDSGIRDWLSFPAVHWEWHYLLLGLLLTALLYLWFQFVFDRLFDHSFEDPRWQNACSPDELAVLLKNSKRLLVFTHPQANSTATVHWLAAGMRESGETRVVHVLDLAAVLTLDEAAWSAQLAGTRANVSGNVLIVDNLEFRFNSEPVRQRSLQLLEQVSSANPGHVCIVSSVDPVLSLESASAENPERRQELARWIRSLAGFERISFDHPFDLQQERLRLAALPKQYYVDCLMIFNREFDRTYYLRTLVPRIMKDFNPALSPTPAHFETYLVNRTLRLADGLYRMLWNTMTADERLVLYQLAADGWVNPMNRVAVAHLVRKRLVFLSASSGALKERGALEVMNESFRRFVLVAQDPAEVRSWENDEQGVLWRGMRLGLMTALLLGAAWVSYVRRDLFDAYIGYLAAATGGSAAVLKWAVDMVRRPSEKKDA